MLEMPRKIRIMRALENYDPLYQNSMKAVCIQWGVTEEEVIAFGDWSSSEEGQDYQQSISEWRVYN